MKRYLILSLLALIPLVSGCVSAGRNTKTGTLLGAAIGAGTGAIVGHQSGNRGPGAAVGAGVGALTGALVGSALDRSEKESELRDAEIENAAREARVAQGALSILDVIRMSQAGVSDQIIIAKIDESRSRFDLSAQDIIDLKRSRVSEPVIEHMVRRSGTSGSVGRAPARRVYRTRTVTRYRMVPAPTHLSAGYVYSD